MGWAKFPFYESGQEEIEPGLLTTQMCTLDRNNSEVTKKIYFCKRSKPSPVDWCNLVDKDFQDIELSIDESAIECMCL